MSSAHADDLRQARELALLFCKSEEAIETFIAHCEIAARDSLLPHGDVVIVLSSNIEPNVYTKHVLPKCNVAARRLASALACIVRIMVTVQNVECIF